MQTETHPTEPAHTWKRQNGQLFYSPIMATLHKKAAGWELRYRGETTTLPPRASFDHADRLIADADRRLGKRPTRRQIQILWAAMKDDRTVDGATLTDAELRELVARGWVGHGNKVTSLGLGVAAADSVHKAHDQLLGISR